jgi:hypothetical protein
MAAELKRKDDDTIILAMHPGEVSTFVPHTPPVWDLLIVHSDMANIDIPWEVDGMMTPEQSVTAMFPVIQSKKIQHSGTFWTWENKVCNICLQFIRVHLCLLVNSLILGSPERSPQPDIDDDST